MDKSVFVKSNEAVLYLVSGKKDALNLPVLDSTAAEGAGEKHLPVVTCSGKNITVKVGSVAHPMSDEHSIDWIFLETKKGGQFMKLSPQEEPVAHFVLAEQDEACAAYAYCNLHGFWKLNYKKFVLLCAADDYWEFISTVL